MPSGLDAAQEAYAARSQKINPGYDTLAFGKVLSYDGTTNSVRVSIDRGGDLGPDEWGPMPIMVGMADAIHARFGGIPAGIGCLVGIISQQQHVSETAQGHICMGFYYNEVVPPPQMPAPTNGPINPGEEYTAGASGTYVYHSNDGQNTGDGAGGLRIFGKAFAAIWATILWLGAQTGIDNTNDAVVTKRYLDAALHAENQGLKTWANGNFQAGTNSAPAPPDPTTQGSSVVKAAQ